MTFINKLLCKIYIACYTLEISTEARWSAFVLFHKCVRVYLQSINTNTSKTLVDQRLAHLASASIFLACKLSNETRRIRDIINIHHMLSFDILSDDDNDDGIPNVITVGCPPLIDESYWEMKRQVVQNEQDLLRVIGFDVSIEFPHRVILAIFEVLMQSKYCQNASKQQSFRVIQDCWTCLNEAMFSSQCVLELRPAVLGCAVLSYVLEEHGWIENTSFENMTWVGWVNESYTDVQNAKNILMAIGKN